METGAPAETDCAVEWGGGGVMYGWMCAHSVQVSVSVAHSLGKMLALPGLGGSFSRLGAHRCCTAWHQVSSCGHSLTLGDWFYWDFDIRQTSAGKVVASVRWGHNESITLWIGAVSSFRDIFCRLGMLFFFLTIDIILKIIFSFSNLFIKEGFKGLQTIFTCLHPYDS